MVEIHTYDLRDAISGGVNDVYERLLHPDSVRESAVVPYELRRGNHLESCLVDEWTRKRGAYPAIGEWSLDKNAVTKMILPTEGGGAGGSRRRKAWLICRPDCVAYPPKGRPELLECKSVGVVWEHYTSIEQLYSRFWWPQLQLYMRAYGADYITLLVDFGGIYQELQLDYVPEDAKRAFDLATALAGCVLSEIHPRDNLAWPTWIEPGVPHPTVKKEEIVDLTTGDGPTLPISLMMRTLSVHKASHDRFDQTRDDLKEHINGHPADGIRNAGRILTKHGTISRNAANALRIDVD